MIFDPFELNYSKIRAYLDCPFLYRYIYAERKFAPQTPHSSLGLSVHRALGAFHARPGDLGDLLQYYEDNWLHHGYGRAQESMEFYNRGARVLEAWWLHWQQNTVTVLYSEKHFEFHFENRGEHVIHKEQLLAIGDKYEKQLAEDRAKDAKYR